MRGVLAALLFIAACADAGDVETNEVEVSADVDAKADATTEVSVRAGDTTLYVQKAIALRETANGPLFVLRGRTSRTLIDGRGFIFDDVYGDFAQKSARVFELTWPLSTVRGLADGVDQLIGLTFVHSSTRPDSLTARAVVRPRLASFTGSSKIYVVAELQPVVVAGETVYRIAGHTYGANTGIRLRVENADVGTVTVDGEGFSIDVSPRTALDWIARGVDLQIIADFPTGGVDKHAKLSLALKKLGMTSGDAELAFPPVSCATSTRSCLVALPDDTLDLGSCGEAIKVNACANQIGASRVDDTSFQAQLHAAGQVLATPAARTDATALVGSDHADQFLYGAEQMVNSELEQMFGRWFLSDATRDAQLSVAVTRGFDRAYARPLDFVDAHPAQPGNAAAMRNVAADAVLAELARMDFVHSEFARSLEDLTHEYRAMHLSDIKDFRENVVAEPYMTTKDVYTGHWLGLYTEVVIDRATGTVESTLVEID